ncbi:MAG: hypothetical protein AAGJ35_14920, partial [Myxococcota bacterium]
MRAGVVSGMGGEHLQDFFESVHSSPHPMELPTTTSTIHEGDMMGVKLMKNAGALQEAVHQEQGQRSIEIAPARMKKKRASSLPSSPMPPVIQQAKTHLGGHPNLFVNEILTAEEDAPVQDELFLDRSFTQLPPPQPIRQQAMVNVNYQEVRMGVFTTTIHEGQRILLIDKHGEAQVIDGPKRVWSYN